MTALTNEEIEQLAEAEHRAFRKLRDIAPPWPSVHPKFREKLLAGLKKIYEPDWFYEEDDSG